MTITLRWWLVAALAGLVIWLAAGFIVYSMAFGASTHCESKQCLHAAIRWQQHDRARLERELATHRRRDARYAIHLAAATFGIDERQMLSVAWCESRMGAQTTAEADSGASGLFQFLGSTWRHTPFSTFDVFDPLPNALAAAQVVKHDGGWRQWTCQPGRR